jgi:hypothetical protein
MGPAAPAKDEHGQADEQLRHGSRLASMILGGSQDHWGVEGLSIPAAYDAAS